MIYLDNAATTFPKPRPMLDRMIEIYGRTGVSPGRGSYDMAAEAEGQVQRAREKVARFFGAAPSDQVIFGNNATDALNLLLQGLLRPKDHVVSTRLEHNSVLRPLHHLKEQGLIETDLAPFNKAGFVDLGQVASLIRPQTRLVIMTHASNVLGTVQPVQAIGRICKERGIPLAVDAAQSAGKIPIHMAAWGVSALAFTGHKSLYGPTGIGGLIFDPDLDIYPLLSTYATGLDYLLLDEALAQNMSEVLELDRDGSVPELKLGNKSPKLILILDGEELVGAKQNRIVNTTILVQRYDTIVIPVSCVEHGRWAYSSTRFKTQERGDQIPESRHLSQLRKSSRRRHGH